MADTNLSSIKAEQQLLSMEALKLPPRERLELLLKAKKYPIVKKRTSARAQIEEMIGFYNLCCLMLIHLLPNKKAENNFFLLNILASHENTQIVLTEKMATAFKLLNGYEELERRITAIQMLFYQYQQYFPDVYELYNLEDIAMKKISDILQDTRQLMSDNPSNFEELMRHWELF